MPRGSLANSISQKALRDPPFQEISRHRKSIKYVTQMRWSHFCRERTHIGASLMSPSSAGWKEKGSVWKSESVGGMHIHTAFSCRKRASMVHTLLISGYSWLCASNWVSGDQHFVCTRSSNPHSRSRRWVWFFLPCLCGRGSWKSRNGHSLWTILHGFMYVNMYAPPAGRALWGVIDLLGWWLS